MFPELNNTALLLFSILLPYLATVLGVFTATLFKEPKKYTQNIMLGFAAGVMLSATVWGLILPAMNSSRPFDIILATCGFALGMLIMLGLDKLLPHLHAYSNQKEGIQTKLPRSILLVLAVALHNLPEGLAMGVVLGSSLSEGSVTSGGVLAMALGLALQNFPEGIAVTFPLINEGISKKKSFLFGQFSGIFEPLCTVLGMFLAVGLSQWMPFLLCLAAGCMIYVIAEELIPQSQSEHSHAGTFGLMGGFWIMAVLAVITG